MSAQSAAASSKSNARKPAKKARTAPGGQYAIGSGSEDTMQKKPLGFHDIPFDILLEILPQLDPMGLINLARADKNTRRALVNKDMDKAVWKSVREDCEALEPPPGWSEAKWVHFLFAPHCYSCGKGNTVIDFYILKRLCVPCKKAGLGHWFDLLGKVWKYGPGPDVAEPGWILFTNYPGSSRKGGGDDILCWKEDFDQTLAVWATLIESTKGGFDRNAVLQLQSFNKGKEDFVCAVHNSAPEMRKWEKGLQKERTKSDKEHMVMRIHQRFMDLGLYKREDIENAINVGTTGICRSAASNVTNRNRKAWRTKLEPAIIGARDRRIKRIRWKRMRSIIMPFLSWVKSLPTIEQYCYYQPFEIWFHSTLAPLREADPDTELDESASQVIIDDFPNFATAVMNSRLNTLRGMIPRSSSIPETLDILDLATSVFTASPQVEPDRQISDACAFSIRGLVAIGWKSLSTCRCIVDVEQYIPPDITGLPAFNPALSEVARTLVALCGLDPTQATMDDMDKLGELFMCCACTKEILDHVDSGSGGLAVGDPEFLNPSSDGLYTSGIFTWRNALNHAYDLEKWCSGDRSKPSFRSVSDLNVPHFRDSVHEAFKDAEGRASIFPEWSCNRCSFYWDMNLRSILNHIRSRHGIAEPVLEEDYFSNPLKPHFWTQYSRLYVRLIPA